MEPGSAGEPSKGAVILRISTVLNYFVGGVSLEGVANPPNRSQLLTASKLDLGAPFAENQLVQSLENMQERLRANGLYRAQVRYELERNPPTEKGCIPLLSHPPKHAPFHGAPLKGTLHDA